MSMNFLDIEFWILAVFVLILIKNLPNKFSVAILLTASVLFYASWNIWFLAVIAVSVATDYICGPLAHPSSGIKRTYAKIFVFLSATLNLSLLAIFKYIREEFASLIETTFSHRPDFFIELGLPIGISFYTFQTISYTVDCYRGKVKPCRSLARFALFVSYFPQLLAGPIEKARNLLPQFNKTKNPSLEEVWHGLLIALWGIFKKAFVADNLYIQVKAVLFSSQLSYIDIAWCSFLVTFVVYCDFSAYSDVAYGISKSFGIRLTRNFKPFLFIRSPVEFWQVWHISLNRWLIEYVHLPLSKLHPLFRGVTLRVLIISLLVGFWHGPEWEWIGWGFFAFLFIFTGSKLQVLLVGKRLQSFIMHLFMLAMFTTLGFWHESRFVNWPEKSISLFIGSAQMSLITHSFIFMAPVLLVDAFEKFKKVEFPYLYIPRKWQLVFIIFGFSIYFYLQPEFHFEFVYFEF